MMNNFKSYEAPSTAYDNPDEPQLEIGGQGEIEFSSPYALLPDQIWVRALLKPIYCEKKISLTFSSRRGDRVGKLLYESGHPEKSLAALDLINSHRHWYVHKGNYYALTRSSRFYWKEEKLFRLNFKTLDRDLEISHTSGAHRPSPYGGRLHWNPRLCEQMMFRSYLGGEDDVIVKTFPASETEPDAPLCSLAYAITSGALKLPLIFEEETYPYRSVAYTPQDIDSVLICFIP